MWRKSINWSFGLKSGMLHGRHEPGDEAEGNVLFWHTQTSFAQLEQYSLVTGETLRVLHSRHAVMMPLHNWQTARLRAHPTRHKQDVP